MKMRFLAVLVTLTYITLFPFIANAADHNTAATDVIIYNAYARAVTGGQKNSAVYMVITNKGHHDHALVSASGSVAQSIELHNHVDDGGVMRMRPVDKIVIPAGESAELKPGGLHIMLIGLRDTLQEGAMVHIDLQFEDGSSSKLMAPVKAVVPEQGGHGHDQGEKHNMQEHKHNM